MPNWCDQNVRISHSDGDKVKALFEKIKKWTSKDWSENGFGTSWLGNVVGHSGIAVIKDDDFYEPDGKFLRCRGQILDLQFYGNEIVIAQETAWAPILRLWKLVCDKYLPDAVIVYDAIEPGCGIYETNDDDLIGNYYIDVFDSPEEFSDLEIEYSVDAEYVEALCKRILKTDKGEVSELVEKVNELYWIQIHKWEFCSVEDCE